MTDDMQPPDIQRMRIAVFGSGAVGQVLAHGLANRGHQVTVGSRTPEDPVVAGRFIGSPVSVSGLRQAAASADLAIFAVPFDGLIAVASAIADTLPPGVTVIDPSVPESPGPDGKPVLAIGHTDSGGEMLQRLLPRAHIVKALNTVNATDMVSPQYPDGPPTLLVCGDYQPAVGQAIAVCSELGWTDILNLGGLACSRLIESLGILWVYSALAAGSWDVAFRLLRRGEHAEP